MKKLIIVLVLLFAAAALFGQSIKIGSFPPGKWLDDRYDAIWEFSTTDGIKILSSTNGSVLWDFAGKTIQDFKITMDGAEPTITFSCPEADRSYSFKPRINGDLTMVIDRPGLDKDTKVIKKQ
jgi:hypothetical protein